MMLGLEDKSFVVGGASRGLGYAVAEQLVAEGAQVLLVARDADALQEVAQKLGELAHPYAADLSESSNIDELAEAAIRLGGLDGVLVNAGGPPFGPALELSDDQWLDAFRIMIGGPVQLLRSLVPQMNDGASVLFITSSSVRHSLSRTSTPRMSCARESQPSQSVLRLGWDHASVSTAWLRVASTPPDRAR
jgi:3-oxoacyl-[acyl-carrier protein] reductase